MNAPANLSDAAFRASVVGAGEVAALFDASPWLTRFELWMRKGGRVATPEFNARNPDGSPVNSRIHWGVKLEKLIVEEACERWSYVPVETPKRVDNGAGLGGHPDKLVRCPERGLGVLEVKTVDWLVSKVSAHVVHEQDHFIWKLGFDETVEHEPPALDQPRGKAIGAYAIAVLKDGSQLLEVMSLEEIEKVRAVSRAKGNGPWVSWWGEMARKTVMRRLSKRLPMSTDLEDSFDRDETLEHEPQHAVSASEARSISRLDALEHSIGANDGTLSDDNPSASEGPADEDCGERITDDLIASTETQQED